MPSALFPSFFLFCAVSAITPGPANLCSLASATAYGRTHALRQWRGIVAGYAIVSLAISLAVWFLGGALTRSLHALTWAGASYMIWLACHILRSDHAEQARQGKHCNFFTGLLVQLTNAKIMVFCTAALTTYALPYADSYLDVFRIAIILPVLGGPAANLIWLLAGAKLQRFFLKNRRPVNAVLAASLIVCAVNLVRQ